MKDLDMSLRELLLKWGRRSLILKEPHHSEGCALKASIINLLAKLVDQNLSIASRKSMSMKVLTIGSLMTKKLLIATSSMILKARLPHL